MIELYDAIMDRPKSINVIDDERKVSPALEHLHKFDCLGFDTETYHSFVKNGPAFDPTEGARTRLIQFGTPEGDVYVFDRYKVSPEFMHKIFPNKFLMVGQNLKFDMKFLMYEYGIYEYGPIWDTMIAEQMIAKGKAVGEKQVEDEMRVFVGLDHIAKRHLGVELPKDEQASQWGNPELYDRQVYYAARDGLITIPIYQVQRDLIWQQGQVRATEIEFDAIPCYGWMELNGVYFDEDAWNATADEVEAKCDELKYKLWARLGTQRVLFEGVRPINLHSRPAVMQAFEALGIKIPLDRKGKISISKENLKAIQQYEEIQLYMEWVKWDKRRTSFGRNWMDKRNPYTGRIHCSLMQIGAETGRSSAKGPNLMQLPKEDMYRNCIKARDGWVLIDPDYSQCELRILCEYSRDKNMLVAFDEGHDLHRYTAHLIFKVALEEVLDKQRGIAKNINFGIVYGIGAARFAEYSGIPIEEAEKIMAYYLQDVYGEMGQWLQWQGNYVFENKMEVSTMSGRKRQYIIDFKDKQKVAAVKRNATNLPIQGTNADITKRALGLMYKEIVARKWLGEVKLLLPVHDEILAEAAGYMALEAEEMMVRNMEQAEGEFLKRVPVKVDSQITTVWAKSPTEKMLDDAREVINLWT